MISFCFNFSAPFFKSAFQVVNIFTAVFAERLCRASSADIVLAVQINGFIRTDFTFALFQL